MRGWVPRVKKKGERGKWGGGFPNSLGRHDVSVEGRNCTNGKRCRSVRRRMGTMRSSLERDLKKGAKKFRRSRGGDLGGGGMQEKIWVRDCSK